MRVGDKIIFTPSAFEGEKSSKGPADKAAKPRNLVGRVTYIHPARRYYTVSAEVNGQTIRESFNFKHR